MGIYRSARSLGEPLLVLALVRGTLASAAAPLPIKLAAGANELQRAEWACEAGGQSLEMLPSKKSVRPRFFLGMVDNSANKRDQTPLVLQGTHLTGLGGVSNDKGWSTIQFDCTLSPDLREAKTFRFDIVSPIPANNASQQTSGAARVPDPAKAAWYVNGTGPIYLFHGVKETDDRDFIASCDKGSGEIKIILTNTVKWLKKDNYVTVSIMSGPGAGLYVARGVLDDNLGVAVPVFAASSSDPLLHWIATGSSLHINVGSELAYDVSLKGAAQAAKSFSTACR